MNMQKLAPLLMSLNTAKSDRDDMLRLILPALLEIDDDMRPFLSATVARQEITRHRRDVERVRRDTVLAVLTEVQKAIPAVKANKGKLDEELLATFPTIASVPEARTKVEVLIDEATKPKEETGETTSTG